jgi:hypothetical protein
MLKARQKEKKTKEGEMQFLWQIYAKEHKR